MKVLAVETATSRQSVAILDGTAVLAKADEEAGGRQGRRLLPTVDRLLRSIGLTLPELDGFAVSIGPGSFTGLRIGLATAMGFRAITGRPLAAVPTLEALAWNVRPDGRLLCPVLKARIGEVYWGFYRWTSEGLLVRVAEERVGPLASLAESIEGPTLMLGEGWAVYGPDLRRLMGDRAAQAVEAPGDVLAASAVSVGLAGIERLARGEAASQGLAPRYVQRAEAEINWMRKAAALSGDGR